MDSVYKLCPRQLSKASPQHCLDVEFPDAHPFYFEVHAQDVHHIHERWPQLSSAHPFYFEEHVQDVHRIHERWPQLSSAGSLDRLFFDIEPFNYSR